MNLFIVYISTVIGGITTTTRIELGSFISAINEEKQNFQYKKELTPSSKITLYMLELLPLKNFIKYNLYNFIPIYNVINSISEIMNEEYTKLHYLADIKSYIDAINNYENNVRKEYYYLSKFLIKQYNLIDDINCEVCKISYDEFKKFIKKNKIKVVEKIEGDDIIRKVKCKGDVRTFVYRNYYQ